jgi:DNA-directed RNA polymerase specialized sigma24 family protein
MNPPPAEPALFPPTAWTLVRRARGPESLRPAQEAMEALCRHYWQPVRRYLIALGCLEVEADDVTQDFFAGFIRKGGFASAEPEAGRLRTLLKKSAQFHLYSHWRRGMAQKRGGPSDGRTAEDISPVEPAAAAESEDAYDRDWAVAVLDVALKRLAESYAQRGRAGLFAVVKHGLLRPGGLPDDRAAARELGSTEAQVRVAVCRARQRLGALLREAVAATTEAAEVEDEVRHLLNVLLRHGGGNP